MPTYKDYGIVLSSYNLAEADEILNIYTKENGLVRAIAKGVKKPKSSFSGKVEQPSCCYFQFAKGKNLDVISDCSQVNSFALLRSDLVRLTYGLLFLEIVSNFAHEMETESTHVYELLYLGLEELQKINNPDLFSVRFIINFLLIHGIRPQLNTCVSCSAEVPWRPSTQVSEMGVNYSYSTALGGLLCSKCSNFVDHKQIKPEVLEILGTAESKTWTPGHMGTGAQIKEYIRSALDLLIEHINLRAKNKIKSFELLVSL